MSEEGEEPSPGDPPQLQPPPLDLSDPSPPNLTPDLSSVRTSTPEDPRAPHLSLQDTLGDLQDQDQDQDHDKNQDFNEDHALISDSDKNLK